MSDEPGLVVVTERLRLRRLTAADARFIRELFTDPAFVRYVGDRGIRGVSDAREYLDAGPLASYEEHGFGLYRVELASSDVPIGICGVLRRDYLADPDLGFAFLPEHRSRGYATEAARATVAHARDDLGLARLCAITHPENEASKRVLEKLGFELERMIRLDEDGAEICLYAL